MEHIKVSSVSEAWRAAARIFPTDYEKNEENSKRAGYPIYETTSTDERFSGFHISDLNTRLEVNMGNETVTIWIEEDAFEIVVKGLTEEEKESLKEVVDKEIRRIKYRRQNGLSCRFEERDIRTCPVCEHEVDREDMYFTKDCHGIPFRLVCDRCYQRIMSKGYDGEYYTEADEQIEDDY